MIGGILAETGLGAEDGAGTMFVAEADESDGSFLMLAPDMAIVTCVEADHLDNYADLAEIQATFAEVHPPDQAGRRCSSHARTTRARRRSRRPRRGSGVRVRSYGTAPDADYRLTAVRSHGMTVHFEVTAGPGAASGAPPRAQLRSRFPASTMR